MAEDKSQEPEKPDWALTSGERKARERAGAGQPARGKRGWLIALVLVVIAAGAGWWWMNRGATGEGEEASAGVASGEGSGSGGLVMQLIPSEMMTVEPSTLRETVKVTGSLAPVRQVHISSEVSGRVEDVFVQPGDRVEAGQLLVQIDMKSLRNQLEQQRATAEATEAQLKLARNQLERTENLLNRGLTPSSELEAGQAQVDQLAASLAAQQKQVESAEDALEHASIVSPFDGMVSSRAVDPGAYVTTGTQLMSLVDLSEMQFEATVPVRYAPMLEPDLTVELTVEGTGGTQVSGTVDRINPVAVEGTRMLPVYVSIDNSDGRLRGGMFASGMLVLGEKPDAIGIPYDAVRSDGEGSYVLKIEDGKSVRQPVEIGENWSGGRITEIVSGLQPGDVIVSQPLGQLRAGTTIEIVGRDGTSEMPAGTAADDDQPAED